MISSPSARRTIDLCMELKCQKAGLPESSSSVIEHKWWTELWDTNVPAKAKTHTWRLARNDLAVGSELQR